jgi:hypothetical protein
MQRGFEPMLTQGKAWQETNWLRHRQGRHLRVIRRGQIRSAQAHKHSARPVHDLPFEPNYEAPLK